MNFLSNFLEQMKDKDDKDESDSKIMLTDSGRQNTQNTADYQAEIQKLMSDYDEAIASKPKASEKEYGWAGHLGAALSGIGSGLKARGGVNEENAASSIYEAADKRRKESDDKALGDWETSQKAISERISNKLALGEHLRKLEEMKRKGTLTPTEQDKHDMDLKWRQSQIDKNNRTGYGEPKPMSVYQERMLGLKEREIEGKTPISKMEEERGKLDVKNVVENEQAIPDMEALVNNGEEIIGIIDSGDHSIGGKMEKAGTIIGGPVGRWVETERSPNDQKIMGYQNQMLLDVLSTQKGTQTEGDRAVAMQIQGSSTTDPTVIKDNIKKLQALTRTKIENTKAASQYLQEHGSLTGFVPKSTFGEKAATSSKKDKYGF